MCANYTCAFAALLSTSFLNQNVLVFRQRSIAKKVAIIVLAIIGNPHGLTLEKRVPVSLQHYIITRDISG